MIAPTLPISLTPDPALPSRDVLLDETAVSHVLAALGPDHDAHVSACVLARVNYQVGKSLRATFRIVVDDQPHTIAARMFREGRSGDAYDRTAARAQACGDLHGVVHVPELESVFWLFPNDRKITTLIPLLAASPPATEAPRLVAYAPEKSATLVYVDSDERPIAYAKVAAAYQAARDYATYNDLLAALRPSNRWLELPVPIAYSSEFRTMWLEAVHGRRLSDSDCTDNPDDLRAFGSAVAVFHLLSAPSAPRFGRFSSSRLVGDAAVIGSVRPDVAHAVDDLARRLAATVPRDDDIVCLHGDLHPKNAIRDCDRLALIDVEDVAIGPAAADLASVIAGFLYLHASGTLTRARFSRIVGAFLTGYADVRPLPDAGSLRWHTAAALFIERASRAVTRIRPLGLAHLDRLLRDAVRVLDREIELS